MALETAIPDRKQLCDFIFLAGVQQSAASLLAAVKNSAGRAAQLTPLIRSVYPDKHPYTQQADQLARFCFPYGVLPSPRPQPICSFVTAVTLAGGTGDRLFLHVLVFPERYGTRLWVPACIACAGRVLLPRLFRPYLEQLQLRWAALLAPRHRALHGKRLHSCARSTSALGRAFSRCWLKTSRGVLSLSVH